MNKVMGWDIVNEFDIQSCYFIHCRTNTLEKDMNHITPPPTYELNSTTEVFLLWQIHEGWYAIKQKKIDHTIVVLKLFDVDKNAWCCIERITYKLLVLDRNTLNHIIVCIIFVLNFVIEYPIRDWYNVKNRPKLTYYSIYVNCLCCLVLGGRARVVLQLSSSSFDYISLFLNYTSWP